MNYKVVPTPRFKRQAKKLLKKYSSLSAELQTLKRDLTGNPTRGQSLGQNVYKLRISAKSKGGQKWRIARDHLFDYRTPEELSTFRQQFYVRRKKKQRREYLL